MITLNEIAYNIKNLAYGGSTSTENNISLRQIKHWIHYHRAKLIADNIDKGILNDQSIYQAMALTLRNSTHGYITGYYQDWDNYDIDSNMGIPPIVNEYIINTPKFPSGKLAGDWIAESSVAGYSTVPGSEQAYHDQYNRDFYGREIKRSQLRGDFRNFGIQSFKTPRPIMLKDNSGIRNVRIHRKTHHPDNPSTESNEGAQGYSKNSISLPRKEWPNYDNYNKFTDNTKPYYSQEVLTHKHNDQLTTNTAQNIITLRNLQVSPNYHGGLETPGDEKIFWKYQAYTDMILENPTDINMMWDWNWYPIFLYPQTIKVEWDDAVTPYPIPMEYVSDLIQRVLQVEIQAGLKTITDEITDGIDETSKLKLSRGAQVQR